MARKSNIEALLAKKEKLEKLLREQAKEIKDAQAREAQAKAKAITDKIRETGLFELDAEIVVEAIKRAAAELTTEKATA